MRSEYSDIPIKWTRVSDHLLLSVMVLEAAAASYYERCQREKANKWCPLCEEHIYGTRVAHMQSQYVVACNNFHWKLSSLSQSRRARCSRSAMAAILEWSLRQ